MELREQVKAVLQEWDSDYIDITEALNKILAILKQPQGASPHSEVDLALIEEQRKEIERLRVQLAGCGVAALGYATGKNAVKKGDYGWSASFQDVEDLWDKYIILVNNLNLVKPQLAMKLSDCSLPKDKECIWVECTYCCYKDKPQPPKEYCECVKPLNYIQKDFCEECHKPVKPQPPKEYCDCKPEDRILCRAMECGLCHKCNKPIPPKPPKEAVRLPEEIIPITIRRDDWDELSDRCVEFRDTINAIIRYERERGEGR